MRRRRVRLPSIPYDGLVSFAGKRVDPAVLQQHCREQFAKMESQPIAQIQDDEAKRTPIGGWKYNRPKRYL
jgi:hypothetical protein